MIMPKPTNKNLFSSTSSLSDLTLTYCGKSGLGQISRAFALNRRTLRLKRPKNLTPTGFPSLRSVISDRLLELTYPYFHDGAAATLSEAVETMGRIQLGKTFNAEENAKIVAFLRSLTGELPQITLPKLPPSTPDTPRAKPFD